MTQLSAPLRSKKEKLSFLDRARKDWQKNRYKYLIVLPVIIYFIIFKYKPMYGALIAFQDFRPSLGMADSPWVGLKHFESFFNDIFFTRLLRNTISISLLNILFSFPAPIIFALLLNELRQDKFKRTVQTVTYFPHFISLVVIAGLIKSFSTSNGVFNDIIAFFGGERSALLQKKEFFRPIYIASGIWQNIGWNSIIYLAALSAIDQEQYEAARIDGASRFKQALHVTIPGILPTIIVLFILRMGSVLSVGHEKILLLYSPPIFEVSDVISTYVYRKGILEAAWSYSSAIDMFNAVINILFLVGSNAIVKKASGKGLF